MLIFSMKRFSQWPGGSEKEWDDMTGVESTGKVTDVIPDVSEVSDFETTAVLNKTASPAFFDCAHTSSQASWQLSQLRCELEQALCGRIVVAHRSWFRLAVTRDFQSSCAFKQPQI